MKTSTVVVLQNPDAGARMSYAKGVGKQPLGEDFAQSGNISAALTFDDRAAAQAFKDEHPDALRRYEPQMVRLWQPQDGEIVVYECTSMFTGAYVNVRLAEVRKVTQRGYVHLKGVTESFSRLDPSLFVQSGRSNFRTYIRPASEDEREKLPRFGDMRSAQALAWELNAKKALDKKTSAT